MARTQAADYEQRRAAIVEKAAALFARQGFNGASVADLAKACETSKSLIYHYYPSKEDILHAVMASHVDTLMDSVVEVQAQSSPARDRLHDLIHLFMHHYVGAADRQKVLLNELDKLPESRRGEVIGKQRRIVAAVTALLVEIMPDLASDAAQASATTMLLFGMINWTHTWYDPAGALSPDDIADLTLGLILRGGTGSGAMPA